MKPRKPTEEEKQQLIEYLLRGRNPETYDLGKIDQADREEITGAVASAAIAVFDNYITDSVGYAGKVMVVIWPTGPQYTDTFTWLDKEHLAQEVISSQNVL
jgi:hypothetical protein